MSGESEESNDEKVVNYFRLKQDYFEERIKIINKLYKKTKFIESTNEKNRYNWVGCYKCNFIKNAKNKKKSWIQDGKHAQPSEFIRVAV